MEDEDCLNVDLAGLKGFFGLVNANHLNQKIYPNLGSDKFLMNKKVRIFISCMLFFRHTLKLLQKPVRSAARVLPVAELIAFG